MLIMNRQLANNDIVIRRSFHSWKDEQDIAEESLKSMNIPYVSTDNVDLLKDIDRSDVVLYESSSAAFQASLRGKLVYKVCVSDVIATEHLVNKENSNQIDYCFDSKSLLVLLNKVKAMSSNDYKKIADKQRLSFNEIYSKVNKKNLRDLLS